MTEHALSRTDTTAVTAQEGDSDGKPSTASCVQVPAWQYGLQAFFPPCLFSLYIMPERRMKALPVNDCVAVMMQQQMVGVGLCNQDSHCPTFSCSLCVWERERHVKHVRSGVKSIVSSRGRTRHTAVSSLLVETLIFLILDLITDDIQRLHFTQNAKNVNSWFTHHYTVQNPSDFLFKVEHERRSFGRMAFSMQWK